MSHFAPEPAARRIGVVLRLHEFINRGVLRGVLKYVARHPELSIVGGTSQVRALDAFRGWRPDGVVASVVPRAGYGVPTVAVIYPCPRVVCVAMDEALTGVLAVRHFQERGFRHFAFVGYSGQWWSRAREAAFVSALRQLAPEFSRSVPRFHFGRFRSGRWLASSRELVNWLVRLPKPVAVFACNDVRGRETVDAALMAGLRIPEDVAVLGVDNDDVECEMAHTPLSSVIYPQAEVGQRAAELLVRQMAGESIAQEPVLIPPLGIQTRHSTDVLAVGDAVVAAAYRFIRTHAGDPIRIADVARHAGVARRTLQLRYSQVLGRSVHEDLSRVRVERATALLTGSQLPLKEVAVHAGFSSAIHLSRVFQGRLHTTPGSVRRHGAPR